MKSKCVGGDLTNSWKDSVRRIHPWKFSFSKGVRKNENNPFKKGLPVYFYHLLPSVILSECYLSVQTVDISFLQRGSFSLSRPSENWGRFRRIKYLKKLREALRSFFCFFHIPHSICLQTEITQWLRRSFLFTGRFSGSEVSVSWVFRIHNRFTSTAKESRRIFWGIDSKTS